MSETISCGGFTFDDRWFTLVKDSDTGKPLLTAKEEALRGVQGPQGAKGDPFSISKIYSSIEEMEADFDNPDVAIDSFVIIENTEHTEDNGKLYIKDETGFDYVTDLSTGTMIEGPQGDPGIGVPHGGTAGQILTKSSEEDYATHWEDPIDLTNYPNRDDLNGLLLPAVNGDDEGKFAVVVDGEWQSGYIEYGEVVHATGYVQLNGYSIPTFDGNQMESIYNTFIAGHSVVISNNNGTKHYKVISVDASDSENIIAKILFEDKFIITYNKFGAVASYTPIVEGQVVTLSREFATSPNDHGYYREWSPNGQGKVWVECGVFITTVAMSVGSRVPLPVTFENGDFHVQVTVLELGNYAATAYRSGDNSSINVRVHDYYGTPKAVKICVEAKGWKA